MSHYLVSHSWKQLPLSTVSKIRVALREKQNKNIRLLYSDPFHFSPTGYLLLFDSKV